MTTTLNCAEHAEAKPWIVCIHLGAIERAIVATEHADLVSGEALCPSCLELSARGELADQQPPLVRLACDGCVRSRWPILDLAPPQPANDASPEGPP